MNATSPVLSEELVPSEIVYAKDQPQYKPLPVLRNKRGIVMSRWRLTPEERKAIAEGADLLLSIWTFNQPLQPLYLEVCEHERSLVETAQWMELL